MLCSSVASSIRHYLSCMGSCFGCCSKTTPIIAVDEPAKGLRIRGRTVQKAASSDGFWSSSPSHLENSTLQSQRSISSVSTSTLNHSSTTGSMNSNSEFINHGLILWNENRQQWIGNARSRSQNKQKKERQLSTSNETYESLLANGSTFPQPIPLSEMIEFLVKIWGQEGMYD